MGGPAHSPPSNSPNGRPPIHRPHPGAAPAIPPADPPRPSPRPRSPRPDSVLGWRAHGATCYGPGPRGRDQSQSALAAPPVPGRPVGLAGVRGPVRAADLPVVPAVGPAGGRRRGRHPERAAHVGRAAADVRVRPGRQLPGVAEDRRPPRLGRVVDRLAGPGRGAGGRRRPAALPVGGGPRRPGRTPGGGVRPGAARPGDDPGGPAGRAADLAGVHPDRPGWAVRAGRGGSARHAGRPRCTSAGAGCRRCSRTRFSNSKQDTDPGLAHANLSARRSARSPARRRPRPGRNGRGVGPHRAVPGLPGRPRGR